MKYEAFRRKGSVSTCCLVLLSWLYVDHPPNTGLKDNVRWGASRFTFLWTLANMATQEVSIPQSGPVFRILIFFPYLRVQKINVKDDSKGWELRKEGMKWNRITAWRMGNGTSHSFNQYAHVQRQGRLGICKQLVSALPTDKRMTSAAELLYVTHRDFHRVANISLILSSFEFKCKKKCRHQQSPLSKVHSRYCPHPLCSQEVRMESDVTLSQRVWGPLPDVTRADFFHRWKHLNSALCNYMRPSLSKHPIARWCS